MERSLCLSLRNLELSQVDKLRKSDVIEIRADYLSDSLERVFQIPSLVEQPCLFTWRSPEEGGASGAAPRGILARALESGYRWVDVEAGSQDPGNALGDIPPSRRWISRHAQEPARGAEEVEAWFQQLAAQEAALYKLVVPANTFGDADAVLRWMDLRTTEQPHSVFCQGASGHATRIIGAMRSNRITFCSPRGEATAPGQPDLETMLNLYRFRELKEDTAVFGVVGSRAMESLSPNLHNRVMALHGYNGVYLPIETDSAAPVWAALRRGVLRGLSVTLPFKVEAGDEADNRSDRARRAGAANTVWMSGNKMEADNTDLLAAEMLFREMLPAGAGITVLGSGGAAAGAAAAAVGLGFSTAICARNQAKGSKLAEALGCVFVGPPQTWRPDGTFLVNATPMDSPPWDEPLESSGILDLTYSDRGEGNGWRSCARKASIAYIGGERFLSLQAVEQIRRFTGIRVKVEDLQVA